MRNIATFYYGYGISHKEVRKFKIEGNDDIKLQKSFQKTSGQLPSDKGLISMLYQALVELCNKKTVKPIKKWGKK